MEEKLYKLYICPAIIFCTENCIHKEKHTSRRACDHTYCFTYRNENDEIKQLIRSEHLNKCIEIEEVNDEEIKIVQEREKVWTYQTKSPARYKYRSIKPVSD